MNWKNIKARLVNWELWPFWMRYINISPMWLYYCLRARSLWFFTPSNPTITFGGFEGEGKREMYQQLPPGSFPNTFYAEPGADFETLEKEVAAAGFQYPFIVKPDVGMAGMLFRKIDNREQWLHYHRHMPVTYLVQALVTYPVEFSVFYYRFPNEAKGVITGFLLKEPMHVFGNGRDTLLQLIENHPKARYRKNELLTWHATNLRSVIPAGEKYYLSHAANLNRGGHFVNLHDEIDEALLSVFDKLNAYSKYFYYGRYDLKANSLEDLKAGRNFLILEYNGSGAEPNHVYNSGYTLRQAQNEILRHWKVLFQISVYNHRQGIAYWPYKQGLDFMKKAKKHFRELASLDERV